MKQVKQFSARPSYVSVKSKLQHAPPPGIPRAGHLIPLPSDPESQTGTFALRPGIV